MCNSLGPQKKTETDKMAEEGYNETDGIEAEEEKEEGVTVTKGGVGQRFRKWIRPCYVWTIPVTSRSCLASAWMSTRHPSTSTNEFREIGSRRCTSWQKFVTR